jgi:hypothetical protein
VTASLELTPAVTLTYTELRVTQAHSGLAAERPWCQRD